MKPSELGNEFMNIDGDVLNYEVANGLQNIGNKYVENGLPVNDMSFANGMGEFETTLNSVVDSTSNADGVDEFYNAGGRSRRRSRRDDRHDARMRRKDSKITLREAKAEKKIATGEAKKTKADAKVGLADAQKRSADALGKGTEGDIAMANALATKEGEKKGLSVGAKVGIGVGILAVLGIVGYVIYKKSKKGK